MNLQLIYIENREAFSISQESSNLLDITGKDWRDSWDQYFYHGDHLGSSAWITDANGEANQYLAYMPFGEALGEQRATGHDIRFKFTGKERDAETGFDYFGARFPIAIGSSDLSVWLSVDPLSDIALGISPYAYVNNNPVMLIDEWGLTPKPPLRKLGQRIRRWRRGIKTKKVPYETRTVEFEKNNVLVNKKLGDKIISDGTIVGKDELVKGKNVLNKYLENAEKFKITFSGFGSDGINISAKEGKKEETVFNGVKDVSETDWITLSNKRPRHISINYEKLFAFDKTATVRVVYKSFKVSATITASASYFKHIENMNERERKKRERKYGKR